MASSKTTREIVHEEHGMQIVHEGRWFHLERDGMPLGGFGSLELAKAGLLKTVGHEFMPKPERKIPPLPTEPIIDGKPLPRHTRVECVAHDGAHKGYVVHDLGFAYAISWDERNATDQPAHVEDYVFCEYGNVRVAAVDERTS